MITPCAQLLASRIPSSKFGSLEGDAAQEVSFLHHRVHHQIMGIDQTQSQATEPRPLDTGLESMRRVRLSQQ
jgi:hypothetical protein